MNQPANKPTETMPKWLAFVLTKRVPCAFLVVAMLTSAYWLNVVLGGIPLLGFLFMLMGMMLHLAVPGVFAMVLLGGGLAYALQVGAIAALVILVISAGSWNAVLIFLGLFVAIPLMMGLALLRSGLASSAWLIAVAMFVAVSLGLVFAMNAEASGLQDFVLQMFKPMFDDMVAALPAGEAEAIGSVRKLQDIMVQIFPGLLMFGLWTIWWSDLLFARKTAKKYGFYRGDESDVLSLSFPKYLVYITLAFVMLASFTTGDMQYILSNGSLLLLGLISVQGIAVAHVWLKHRAMTNTLILMYITLFFWSMVIAVFTIIGLLDFWFNFRRNAISATGEK